MHLSGRTTEAWRDARHNWSESWSICEDSVWGDTLVQNQSSCLFMFRDFYFVEYFSLFLTLWLLPSRRYCQKHLFLFIAYLMSNKIHILYSQTTLVNSKFTSSTKFSHWKVESVFSIWYNENLKFNIIHSVLTPTHSLSVILLCYAVSWSHAAPGSPLNLHISGMSSYHPCNGCRNMAISLHFLSGQFSTL